MNAFIPISIMALLVVVLLITVTRIVSLPNEIKIFLKYCFVCCVAGVCSVLVFAVSVFAAMVFIPVDPEQDHVRGALYTLQLVPVLCIILPLYFLILGSKVSRTLKNAVIAQSVILFPFSIAAGYPGIVEAGLALGVVLFSISFVYLSIVLGVGSLVWAKYKIT